MNVSPAEVVMYGADVLVVMVKGMLNVSSKSVAEVDMEIGVPEIVTTPPGIRVWLPRMRADSEIGVYVLPPIVKIDTSDDGVTVACKFWALFWMLRVSFESRNDIEDPSAVTAAPGVSIYQFRPGRSKLTCRRL